MEQQAPAHPLYYDHSSGYQPPVLQGYFPLNCYTSLLPSPAHVSKDHHGHPQQHQQSQIQQHQHLMQHPQNVHHEFEQKNFVEALMGPKSVAVNLATEKLYHSKLLLHHQIQHQPQMQPQQQLPLTQTHQPVQQRDQPQQHQSNILEEQNVFNPHVQPNFYSDVNYSNTQWQTAVPTTETTYPVTTTSSRPSNTSNPEDKVKKKLACDQCDFSTFNKKTLTNHIAKHTGQGLHTCPHCPFNSAYLGTFKRHMIRKHDRKDLENTMKDKRDRLHCPHCPFVTIYKKNMKKHVAKHTGEGVHKCQHCNYVTAYIAGFRKHLQKHAREEDYSCPHCSYKSPMKGYFERHLASRHSERKTFACEFCSFTTPHKRSLKNHSLKHSESERKVKLSEANVSGDDRKTSKLNGSKQENIDQFYCTHCPYSTNLKGLFKIHVNNHQENDILPGNRNSVSNYNKSTHTPSDNMLSHHHQQQQQQQQIQHQQNIVQQTSSLLNTNSPYIQPSHFPNQIIPHQAQQSGQLVHMQSLPVQNNIHSYPYNNVIQSHTIQGKQTQLQALVNSCHDNSFQFQNNNNDIDHNVKSNNLSTIYSNQPNISDKSKMTKKTGQGDETSKILTCKQCSFTTAVKNEMHRHSLSHSGKSLHSCPHCPFTTPYRGTFKRHMSSKHSKEKKYECPFCSYTSTQKGFYERHVAKHSEVSPHQCPHCDYSTTRKGTFKRHLETHEKDKQKKKGFRYRLLQDKPEIGKFRCEHCEYSSDIMTTFRRHVVKHTKDDLFSCLQCSYSIECQSTFMKHIQKHETSYTDPKLGYSCPHCEYKTTARKRYDAHIINKHNRKSLAKKKKRRKIKKKPDDLSDEEGTAEDASPGISSTASANQQNNAKKSAANKSEIVEVQPSLEFKQENLQIAKKSVNISEKISLVDNTYQSSNTNSSVIDTLVNNNVIENNICSNASNNSYISHNITTINSSENFKNAPMPLNMTSSQVMATNMSYQRQQIGLHDAGHSHTMETTQNGLLNNISTCASDVNNITSNSLNNVSLENCVNNSYNSQNNIPLPVSTTSSVLLNNSARSMLPASNLSHCATASPHSNHAATGLPTNPPQGLHVHPHNLPNNIGLGSATNHSALFRHSLFF